MSGAFYRIYYHWTHQSSNHPFAPDLILNSYIHHVLLLSDRFLALSSQRSPINVFDLLNLLFLPLQKTSLTVL